MFKLKTNAANSFFCHSVGVTAVTFAYEWHHVHTLYTSITSPLPGAHMLNNFSWCFEGKTWIKLKSNNGILNKLNKTPVFFVVFFKSQQKYFGGGSNQALVNQLNSFPIPTFCSQQGILRLALCSKRLPESFLHQYLQFSPRKIFWMHH